MHRLARSWRSLGKIAGIRNLCKPSGERAMRIAVVAAILGMLSSSTFAGQVYRCTVAGSVVYADNPCDDAGKAVSVSVVPRAAEQPTGLSTPEPYQLQHEAGMGRVAVGQTADQVRQAWGDPKSINVDTNSRGRTDQWVYARDGVDSYVYLQNGHVTSVSTQASSVSVPPTVAAPFPQTQAELEAQERADKAGERRFVRAHWSRGRVLDAIGPPERNINNGESWIYMPTTKDIQTVTTVVFDGDYVFDVKRDVVNR